MLKKLPLGLQTFQDLIVENYLYVDKTKDIYKFFEQGGKYYFLSRPRRFGKSLLVSTLKSLFLGHQELFKDLWIYDKIEWKEHPVIPIDFSTMSYNTPEQLANSLSKRINNIGKNYHIPLETEPMDYKGRFEELITKLSQQEKMVTLFSITLIPFSLCFTIKNLIIIGLLQGLPLSLSNSLKTITLISNSSSIVKPIQVSLKVMMSIK